MFSSVKAAKNVAMLGLASTMMFAGAGVGFAAENDLSGVNSQAVAVDSNVNDPYETLEQQEQLQANLSALAVGESMTIPGAQGSVFVMNTATGLAFSVLGTVDKTESTTASFCGVALASALVGIGAGGLAALAAMTGGGSVLIAGVALSGAQIGVAAGFTASYSALLAWVSTNVC